MGTVEGLCNDIQGRVWKVNVDEMTAEELMKNYLTSNIKKSWWKCTYADH